MQARSPLRCHAGGRRAPITTDAAQYDTAGRVIPPREGRDDAGRDGAAREALRRRAAEGVAHVGVIKLDPEGTDGLLGLRIDEGFRDPAPDKAAVVAPFEHVDVPRAEAERVGLLELGLRELPEI